MRARRPFGLTSHRMVPIPGVTQSAGLIKSTWRTNGFMLTFPLWPLATGGVTGSNAVSLRDWPLLPLVISARDRPVESQRTLRGVD